MPNPIKKKNHTALDLEVNRLLEAMGTMEPTSEEYSVLVKQLDSLTKINSNTEDKVSKETMLAIAANLGGIAMILTHEQTHALTSKAIGFIAKVKL